MKKIIVGTKKAGKLLLICNSLDKEMGGLGGKVNLLTQVRYGVYGPTLYDVKKVSDG